MSQQQIMRFTGGPLDGRTVFIEGWPPPEEVRAEQIDPLLSLLETKPVGSYRKQRQSQITDEQAAQMPNVVRGAEYDWLMEITDPDAPPLGGA